MRMRKRKYVKSLRLSLDTKHISDLTHHGAESLVVFLSLKSFASIRRVEGEKKERKK